MYVCVCVCVCVCVQNLDFHDSTFYRGHLRCNRKYLTAHMEGRGLSLWIKIMDCEIYLPFKDNLYKNMANVANVAYNFGG